MMAVSILPPVWFMWTVGIVLVLIGAGALYALYRLWPADQDVRDWLAGAPPVPTDTLPPWDAAWHRAGQPTTRYQPGDWTAEGFVFICSWHEGSSELTAKVQRSGLPMTHGLCPACEGRITEELGLTERRRQLRSAVESRRMQ